MPLCGETVSPAVGTMQHAVHRSCDEACGHSNVASPEDVSEPVE